MTRAKQGKTAKAVLRRVNEIAAKGASNPHSSVWAHGLLMIKELTDRFVSAEDAAGGGAAVPESAAGATRTGQGKGGGGLTGYHIFMSAFKKSPEYLGADDEDKPSILKNAWKESDQADYAAQAKAKLRCAGEGQACA